jgi:3-deoxy-D-manno-octulosonic-acid transferase
MTFIYSAVLALALVLTLPYWALQMLRRRKYRAGLLERLGRVPARLLARHGEPSIWVHAVSVGELLAVSSIIFELRKRFPSHRVVVSTTTATGQKLARERFGEENVFFFPLDFAYALRPYFDALRPALIVVAETELWPNFFRLARARGVKLAVINARISDRSFPRYRIVAHWLSPVLDNVDLFLAQGCEDAGRLVAIGASSDRVEAVGNLKFDIPAVSGTALVAQLQRALAGPMIVCGSTVEGEEPVILSAFEVVHRECPACVLLLAPRHPERFAGVVETVQSFASRNSVSFSRRSQWDGQPFGGGIFLLDTIGELAAVYALATIAFVGGSLVPRGGHNILEAARFGVPIVVGPHNENFRDIIDLFRRAGAVTVLGPEALPSELLSLMRDPERRRELGARAQATWRQNSGATARTLERVEDLMARPALAAVPPRKESA